MRRSRLSVAGLTVLALFFAACSSSASPSAPPATSAPSSAPSAPATTAAAAPTVAVPPAPTGFTATRKSGSAPCPSADDSCSQTDFAWQASVDPGTGFKIYWAGTGEDPAATCQTAQADATVRIDAKPSARSAQVFDPMAVGGGQMCYWITAVNGAGESVQVPAAGNEASAPSAASVPSVPTGFTATEKLGSVPCPSADGSCSQADFAWQSNAEPETWFRIYKASFGLDPNGTCPGVQADAKAVLDTNPAARNAKLFEPMAVGGGKGCYWITAVNSAGESAQVPATGN